MFSAEYAGVRRRADRGAKRRQRGRLITCLIGLHEQRLNVCEVAGLRAPRLATWQVVSRWIGGPGWRGGLQLTSRVARRGPAASG